MIPINLVEKQIKSDGTPFYLFDTDEFKKNYQHLLKSFRNIYPNYNIAYSYKTNYTPYICELVHEMGGYAEVVSDMEYQLAKRIGYTNDNIIYNGPCKGELLDEHLLNGGVSNIDSRDEALRIIELAKKNPKVEIRVGIRVNADVGANFISRFGIELNDEKFGETVRILELVPNIKIIGLHCHVSRARGLEAWKRRIENLLYATEKYLSKTPEFIDLGSGMFGEMTPFLKEQFGDNVPTYEDYAVAVATIMAKHYSDSTFKPMLITEPGTTVVARYLSIVCSVEQIKYIQDKCFATVDISYDNVGSICHMKVLPYQIIPAENRRSIKATNADIMGYTCLEQDRIYTDFPEELYVDDVLIIENVGGYSIVSKPPFIRPNCSVYAITNDKLLLIKRKETFEDVFHTFFDLKRGKKD